MKKFIFVLLIGITFFIPKNIVYGSPIILSTETWNEKEVEKIFEKYYRDFEDYEKLDFVLSKSEKEEFEPSISVDKVIEDLQEQVYDELEDEDYLENLKEKEKDELEESLNLVLKKFLKRYDLKPNNYLVKNKKCFLVRSDGKVYDETNCEDEEY